MVVWHGIEEVGISIRGGWSVDRLPLCKAALTVSNKQSPRCGKVLNMSENTKEIPIWVGGESGQRKRYLKSLEKDLAAELGADWRDKIADCSDAATLS